MESWSLREEILKIINKWYLVLLFTILGGVAGLALSYILPAPYRATADLYVGIDITRVNEMQYLIPLANTEPLNLDDYKNWQLKQVSSILSSDEVILNTLEALGKPEDLGSFKKDIDLYWYDTGVWQLEVIKLDKNEARKAVQAWLEEGNKKIERLLEISDVTARLDAQLFALADEIGSLKSRTSKLESFQNSAEEWQSVFSSQDQTQPLDDNLLTELNAWILVYRKSGQLWQIPVGDFPQPAAPVPHYVIWLEDANILAEQDLQESLDQLSILEEDREKVLPEYHEALDDSLGLSANLVLQPLSSDVEVSQTRATGESVLGGGILGLLAWFIIAIVNISLSGKEND